MHHWVDAIGEGRRVTRHFAAGTWVPSPELMGQAGTTMRDSACKREPSASEAASTSGGGREAVGADAETSCWSADGAAPVQQAPTTTTGSVADLPSSPSLEDSGEDTAEDCEGDEEDGGTVCCTLKQPAVASDWSYRCVALVGQAGKPITLALVKLLGAGGFGARGQGGVMRSILLKLRGLPPSSCPLSPGAVLAAQVIDGGGVPELVEGTVIALKYDLQVQVPEPLSAVRRLKLLQQQAPPRWAWSPFKPLVELPVASVVREAHAIAHLHGPRVAHLRQGAGVQGQQQQPLVPAWCIPAIIQGWPAIARAADDDGDGVHVSVNCTCILMPLYGANVYRWLSSQQAAYGVPLSEVCRLGQAMVACVQRVHAAGILHLDIKPENFVLRDADGSGPGGIAGGLVLLDFGLSCDAGSRRHRPVKSSNNDSSFFGTPAYASQLQLLAEEPLSFRDDLEAMFNVLAEAAAGEPLPWRFKLTGSEDAILQEGFTSQGALSFKDMLQQRCAIDCHRGCFAAFFANQPAPLRRLDAAVQALQYGEAPDYEALKAALQPTAAEEFQWAAVLQAAYATGRRVHPVPRMDGRKRKRGAAAADQGAQGSTAPGALGSHEAVTVALRVVRRGGGK